MTRPVLVEVREVQGVAGAGILIAPTTINIAAGNFQQLTASPTTLTLVPAPGTNKRLRIWWVNGIKDTISTSDHLWRYLATPGTPSIIAYMRNNGTHEGHFITFPGSGILLALNSALTANIYTSTVGEYVDWTVGYTVE